MADEKQASKEEVGTEYFYKDQVFLFFFSAAGNKMLLRMRR